MPLPVIDNVWQAVIDWVSTEGQTAKNVLYFKNTVGGTATDLATALGDQAVPDMFHTISDHASAPTVTIRKLDGVSAPVPEPLENWAGTEGDEYGPALSVVMTLYTAVAGRSNRGRVYLPFTAESVQVDGHLIGDAAVLPQPAWTTFLAGMNDDDWVWQVASLIRKTTHTVHNEDHSVTRGVPLDDVEPHSNDVTRVQVRNILATQRRRQSRLRIA